MESKLGSTLGNALKLTPDLEGKLARLRNVLSNYENLAVAFSGGVDSALLAVVAHDVLGEDVVAITGCSPSMPARELEEAVTFCAERGITHVIVDTHEFDIEGFERNPIDRCYICKRELLACIGKEARERGIGTIAEGSNVDDMGDFRPGFRAIAEMNAASPLRDAGLAKSDIRALAKYLGIPMWNKPAFACLNTRFAYGDLISPELLTMVDDAEQAVLAHGFTQVRVRVQDKTARIEVAPQDIERLAETRCRNTIVEALEKIGFTFVSLDLKGYRTGSMNVDVDEL